MTAARTFAADIETFADLLERLGDVPPERIRLTPPPGTASEADVLELERRTNRLFELVDGTLVEKAMGFRESFLAAVLIGILGSHVRQARLGIVVGADGMMRLATGLVRIPDVAFVSWARLPGGKIPAAPVPALAPNLAIEILSAGNRPREMARKRGEYFAAGVEQVWEIDAEARTVTVYQDPQRCDIYDTSMTIDAGSIIPGFKLVIADLFAELDA